MNFDEMKKIADARTGGELLVCDVAPHLKYSLLACTDCCIVETVYAGDAKFIAMAANNWGKIMAVVEAAKKIGCYGEWECEGFGFYDLSKALENLEQE